MSLSRIILLFLMVIVVKTSYGQSKFFVKLELFPYEITNKSWIYSDLEQDSQYAENVQVSSRYNTSMGLTLGYDLHQKLNLLLNVNAKNINNGLQYIGYCPLIMGPTTSDKQALYDSWRPDALKSLYLPEEILKNKWNFFLVDVSLGVEVPLSKRLRLGVAVGKILLQRYQEHFSFWLDMELDPDLNNNPQDWWLLRGAFASIDDDRYTEIYQKLIQESKYFNDPIYYGATTFKASVSYDILPIVACTAGIDLTTAKRNQQYYNLKISNDYFQPDNPNLKTYNDIYLYSSYFLWRMGFEVKLWDGHRGKKYKIKHNTNF